jgi:hypothetical protein
MASTPDVATALLQVALVVGVALVGQVVAVRHLPVETIPGCLQSRIALSNRLRPFLIAAAAVMAAAGLVLELV